MTRRKPWGGKGRGVGDAALAMGAYNAGANKMRRVLRRIEDPVNDRDFWYLHRMGLLPNETNQYVPKIIAMILIDRDREKSGFFKPGRIPDPEKPKPKSGIFITSVT